MSAASRGAMNHGGATWNLTATVRVRGPAIHFPRLSIIR
jgi:hypothetical protein